MSSQTENIHVRNIELFDDLISLCADFGTSYNPQRTNLTIQMLFTQLARANAVLREATFAKEVYDQALRERELTLRKLKCVTPKILDFLSITSVLSKTRLRAGQLNGRMLGRRRRKDATVNAKVLQRPMSQKSINKVLGYFAQLVTQLGHERQYQPVEPELQRDALMTLLIELQAKNTAVVNTYTTLSNVRAIRDRLLYAQFFGIIDVVVAVKQYVKSVYGAESQYFKKLNAFRFQRTRGK